MIKSSESSRVICTGWQKSSHVADRVGKDLLQSIYKETGFDPTKL